MNPFDWLDRSVTQAALFAHQHPRGVSTAVAGALLGFAAAAFGIAPLAPDAAQLPRTIIAEQLVLSGLDQQIEALAVHEIALSRTDVTRAQDTADTLLRRLGVNDPSAAAFLRSDAQARRLLEGRAGKLVQVSARSNGQLLELVARYPSDVNDKAGTHFSRLTVVHDDTGWRSLHELAELRTQVRLGSGTIRSSLFAATEEARLPDPVAIQIAEVFAGEIDFHRELRKGDTFSVVYEALTADDQPITWNQGTGRVLAAEFNNAGRSLQAVWFRDGNGKGAYFDLAGQSRRRAFLASPLEFSRVTSGFAMRLHPIHKSWRAHLGVDYGAPTGTPVRSVGDAVVEFAGVQNGYGKTVVLRHTNDRTTLYAHLSRIDVKAGQRIEQGQRLGAVGSTGWSTGSHLHFEFRVKGQHQDPLKIARTAEAVPIAPSSRAEFLAHAKGVRAQLTAAHEVTGLHAE